MAKKTLQSFLKAKKKKTEFIIDMRLFTILKMIKTAIISKSEKKIEFIIDMSLCDLLRIV